MLFRKQFFSFFTLIISICFFGRTVYGAENGPTIFANFCDTTPPQLIIPKELTRNDLNRILGISVQKGNLGEFNSRLNIFVAALYLQAKFCNALAKENSLYNLWQNEAKALKKKLKEIAEKEKARAPLGIRFDDGAQSLGTLYLSSQETISLFLYLNKQYIQPDNVVRITNFDSKAMAILRSSRNKKISEFGKLIEDYQKVTEYYRVYDHHLCVARELIHAQENIPSKYEYLSQKPFFQESVEKPHLFCFKQMFNLFDNYMKFLLQQDETGTLTNRLTKEDKRYAKALGHISNIYLNAKPGLERLYKFAREVQIKQLAHNETIQESGAKNIRTDRTQIIGFSPPDSIEETWTKNSLFNEVPAVKSNFSQSIHNDVKAYFQDINKQYEQEEDSTEESSEELQEEEEEEEDITEQLAQKKKNRAKGKTKSAKQPRAAKATKKKKEQQTKPHQNTSARQKKQKNKQPSQPQTPVKKREKRSIKKKRKKEAPLQAELRRKKQRAEEEYIKYSLEYEQEKREKEERRKKKKLQKRKSPKKQPMVYESASDDSKVFEETPLYVSIDDPKNDVAIINLYKTSQGNKKLEPFEYSYAQRVERWFKAPEDVLRQDPHYNDKVYAQDENKKIRVIAIHNFAKAMDPYIFQHGFQETKQTERGENLNIVVPGELLLGDNQTEYGYFVYGFYTNTEGKKVCYHRVFTIIPPNEFIASLAQKNRDEMTKAIMQEYEALPSTHPTSNAPYHSLDAFHHTS